MSGFEEARSSERDEETMMTEQEALRWLRQVDGAVYHNRHDGDEDNTWVAVVRTPPAPGNLGKIIMAFGPSVEEAACAAEEQWQQEWGFLSAIN